MELHHRAVQLAKDLVQKESELLEVLMQMKKKGAFVTLGYPGVFAYVVEALKLGEAQAFYFQKVVAKAFEVPALKDAVVSGGLSLSKARRIVPVLTRENSDEWITKAKTLRQRELERAVAEQNPAARVREQLKPVGPRLLQMVVAITPEVEARLRRVQDLESQRTKKDVSWNEALQALAEEYLEKHDPLVRARRVSSRKPRPAAPPRPGRHRITAHVKHQVTLRDQNRCTANLPTGTRCGQRRWLELDHLTPVHAGGVNTVQNLRILCAFHHRLRHDSPS